MKAICLRITTVSMFALLACATLAGTVYAEGTDLDAAMDHYEAGEYEQALEKLRAYVASNPDDSEVYDVVNATEDKVLLRALTKGGDHERLVKWLLAKARPTASNSGMSDEEIQATAREAVENDAIDVRRRAQVRLRQAGEQAVPHLYTYLASDSVDQVVNAILSLKQLGSDAVAPLAEVLHSDNAQVRGYAAAVLGEIGDPAAAAALKAASDDEDAGVAAKAQNALGKLGVAVGSAADAYVALGRRYLGKDLSLTRNFDANRVIWRWQDGGLAQSSVPYWLFHDQMAEECASDALAENPGHANAAALLVRALLSQQVDAAARDDESVAGGMHVAQALGYQAANDALAASLVKRDWDVAMAATWLVAQTWGGESLAGSALGDALAADSKQVRFHAAIAALHMGPQNGMPNQDKVAGLAAEAAGSDAVRQVLVIDDNDNTRGKLVLMLTQGGYVVQQEAHGAVGVSRAKSSPTMDVVIVRADLGDQANTIPGERHLSSLLVLDELMRDPRTQDLSIVVLVSDTPENKMAAVRDLFSTKYGDKLKGFVDADLADESTMAEIAAAAQAKDLNADRQQADALAAAAAGAFAAMDPNCTAFNVGVAVDALGAAATGGNTAAIRMNAVKGLGNIRAGGADALVTVLAEGADDEIKAAAAAALGNVLSRNDASPEQVEALMGAAKAGGSVGTAALKALGQVRNLTAEQRREVFNAHRVKVGAGD